MRLGQAFKIDRTIYIIHPCSLVNSTITSMVRPDSKSRARAVFPAPDSDLTFAGSRTCELETVVLVLTAGLGDEIDDGIRTGSGIAAFRNEE